MFPAILLTAALCGQVFAPDSTAGVFPASSKAVGVFAARPAEPPSHRPAAADAPCRDVPAMVIGTVGVPAADGTIVPVITDYPTARKLAADEGRPLVVFAGPGASALAALRNANPGQAVYAIGDPVTFPAPGVYEYRAGDLVGGKLAAFAAESPPAAAAPRSRRAVRYSCGPSGCFPVPE